MSDELKEAVKAAMRELILSGDLNFACNSTTNNPKKKIVCRACDRICYHSQSGDGLCREWRKWK